MPDADRNLNAVHKKFSVTAILMGWFLTIAIFIWNVSSTNTNYIYRLDRIEKEIITIDERLDIGDAFRMQINTDIAQIKTDLLWIRKTLEHTSK